MMQGLLKKQRIEHRRFTPRPISFSSKTLMHGVIYKKRSPLVLPAPRMAPTFSDLEKPSLLGLLIALSLLGTSCFFVVQNLRGFSLVSLPSLTLFYASLDQGMIEKTTHRDIQQHLTQYVSPPPVSQSLETDEGSLDLTELFSWKTYRVQKGDTLLSIARRFSLAIDTIVSVNNLSSARLLRVGSTIKIPNMDGILYTVQRGDSLSRISRQWGIPMTAILDANDLASATIIPGTVLFLPGAKMNPTELKRVLGTLFIMPIKGRISSPYGWREDPFTGDRRFHAAIDIVAPLGTPVPASREGRVAAVGFNMVYGNYVILSHDGGYQTMYAHLDSVRIQKGQSLSQGAIIGTVGTTGYSTGPHLHFGVFKNGQAINPLSVLP
ncbi:M23 family metallopeptidase [Treponema sp. J25]|uniref:peptidoglycan DD-metalloendopeptidase family protein n=1 Tax=Treponema sp. J25 TaxID=2094121 RepID=UPI00104E721B|nr:M23 family metallopeptidase [Treponema sp. J25]TCW62653.1 M23 family peptidase [Treponema sp. J25]